MNKSDLRSGMMVTLRNGTHYMVLLSTGMTGDMEDVLIRKVGSDTSWMPLSDYDDDLTFSDSEPDDIFDLVETNDDAEWDIMTVSSVRQAAYIGLPLYYKTIWTREE